MKKILNRVLGMRGMVLVVIVSGLSAMGAEGEEGMTFIFNPPPGTAFVEQGKFHRENDMGSLGLQVDQSEQSIKVRIDKTADGFVLKARPIAMSMTRNGQPAPGEAFQPMMDVDIIYHLDAAGRIQKIKGLDKIIKKMKANFSDAHPDLVQSSSEAAMVQKETTEYNARIGDFIGKRFKIGDVWTMESEYPLPGGKTLRYVSVTVFRGMQPCGKTQCVKVDFIYDSDPGRLKTLVQDIFDRLDAPTRAFMETVAVSDGSLSADGYRLIDPDTMLIYEETMTRVMKIPRSLSAAEKIFTAMTETKSYGYQYE